LSCSHISELICSRTWRAFSRAAATQAAMASLVPRSAVSPPCLPFEADGGNGTLATRRPQVPAAPSGVRSSVWFMLTDTTRAVCSARSRYRAIQ
jgi:hypothetical protein